MTDKCGTVQYLLVKPQRSFLNCEVTPRYAELVLEKGRSPELTQQQKAVGKVQTPPAYNFSVRQF